MKKIIAMLLILVMLIPTAVSIAADYKNSATDCNKNKVVSKQEYELTSGATETAYVLNTLTYSDRNRVDAVEVDLSNPNVSAEPGYYNIAGFSSSNLAQQTVLAHADYAENTQGKDVVAAINISSTWTCNAPYGLLIYNGVMLYDSRSRCPSCSSSHKGGGYLVITDDGRAELREPNAALKGNELHAVTLWGNVLVKNGVNQFGEDHGSGTSRSAIGIKADGTLVLVGNERSEESVSNGMTMHEIADTMLSLGCENAIACEGGGATVTYTKRAGEDSLSVRTVPSDGYPRTTSTSLLITANGSEARKVASGHMGVMAKWTLDSNGNLTVSGNGAMPDFTAGEKPWSQYTDRYPITRVVIEEGITSVGDNAFYNCKSLSSVSLPSTLKSIGYRSFMNCSSLTYVYIPASVDTLGSSAFAGCSSVTDITLPEEMENIGSSCFYGCRSLQSIVLPYGIAEIPYQLFVNCTSLSSLQIRTKSVGALKMGVTSIGQYAFSGCTALKSLVLPDTVYRISSEAFEFCNGLTLTIPKSVKIIENGLFYMATDCSVKCVQFSYAEEYAIENSIPYAYTEESRIKEKLGKVDLGPYDIEGAYIDFGGTVIPLIDLEATVELGAYDLKFVSNDNGTVRILLGFDDTKEANIKGAQDDESYWSNAYKEVKALYTGVTGKGVHDTRLWNGFSSLRGKLKKHNATMVVDVSTGVAGYLEFKETDGELVLTEGGLLAEFSADATVRTHNPVYVVMGVGVGAKGEIYFQKTGETIKPDMRLESSLSLTLGLGCDVAVGYIEGYATGTLYCTVDSKTPEPFTLTAGLSGLFHGSVFGRQFLNQPFEFETVQLYPKNNSRAMALTKEVSDLAGYTVQINEAPPLDRDYLAEDTEISSSNAYFRKDNAYPYTYPSLVSFEDGAMLMVWTDDTGEKSADNAGTIMYSYYNGSYWSDPRVMYEDGCNSSSPVLFSDESKAYIVWQKANEVFEEGVETSDMLKAVDLYVSEFNKESMSFTQPVCITPEEEGIFEFSPQIIKTDDGIRVYWIENSDNNLFMMSGVNSLYCKDIYTDGTLSDRSLVSVSEDIISDIALTDSGAYYSIYTEEGMTLYFEDGSVIDTDIGRIESAQNLLYYTKKGMLYSYADGEGYAYGLSESVDDLRMVSTDGYTYLFTSVLNTDGTKTLYYTQLDTENKSASALEKYSSEEGYIGSYSPTVLPDGKLHVAYSYITKAADGSYLSSSVLVDAASDDIETELSYVIFDNTDLGDGELELTLGFYNHSSSDINSVDICVRDGEGSIITKDNISTDIKAYSDGELKYVLMYENSVDMISVTATPSDYTDHNTSNNTKDTTLDCLHLCGDWQTVIEATYLSEGTEQISCEDCGAIIDTRSVDKLVPELSVDNYRITLTGAEYIKDIRYVLGEYTTTTEIRNAEGNVALDNSIVAKNTVDDSFVYDLPDGGVYSMWVRMQDGTNYILPIDMTSFVPEVTTYGVKITVDGLYDIKDCFIAKGEYNTYNEIKNNGYIVRLTPQKVAGKHSYEYTVSESGMHTVLVRYNNGSEFIFHEDLVVDEPVFTTNGLQITISNIPDVKVIRTAYGIYNTPGDTKRAEGARNFSNKAVIKDAEEYMIQYRNKGTVTVVVEYNNGYVKMFHHEITKKEATAEQNGNSVTFGNLDGLVMIRYAKGEYSASSEIKKAPGSRVIKPDAIADGKITVSDLSVGTYTFCVQFDDDSYNYFTITAE